MVLVAGVITGVVGVVKVVDGVIGVLDAAFEVVYVVIGAVKVLLEEVIAIVRVLIFPRGLTRQRVFRPRCLISGSERPLPRHHCMRCRLLVTGPLWAVNVAVCRAVATSQSTTVWSELPVANVLPSGLNATELTASVWADRVAMPWRRSTSHNRASLSSLPLARVSPSGEKTTAGMKPA